MSGIVQILNGITGPSGLKFQSIATLDSFVTDGGIGDDVTTPKKYSVVVTRKQRQVMSSGRFVTSTTTVLFFGPVDVKVNDVITLADGSGGPVLSVNSPVDASGRLITEVYLG